MNLKDALNENIINQVQPRPIIKNNRDFLSEPCEKASIVEAEEIWGILEATLDVHGDGFGLSANQIGIKKAVALIKFEDKTYKLLNPRIIQVGKDRMIIPQEGCLSFPKKVCKTVRYTEIVVEDDNLGTLSLSLKDSFLPIIFQHEIDHLNGRTIFDNVLIIPTYHAPKVPGRNEKCTCGSGKKYKHCCLTKSL